MTDLDFTLIYATLLYPDLASLPNQLITTIRIYQVICTPHLPPLVPTIMPTPIATRWDINHFTSQVPHVHVVFLATHPDAGFTGHGKHSELLLQKQIGFLNHRVVTLIADKMQKQWLCIVCLDNCIRQPERKLPRPTYNQDLTVSNH